MAATSADLEPLARKLEYWNPLSAEDRAALLALPRSVRQVPAHHLVVREREAAAYSCLMLTGFSIRHKVVADGQRQIVAIHMKGEMVDLQNSLLGIADHSVEMLTAGAIAMIPREAVKRIALERPAVAMAMWLDTLVDASIFREWIANIGRRDARTRLAHLLCEFSLRLKVAGLGRQSNYELPMTQEQLADATGMTAVHVNRCMRSLEREGLIERSSPRGVTIGNWKKLATAGDFDSTYLHLRSGEPALAEA
jgi:CRP-like cAMP-binding protein